MGLVWERYVDFRFALPSPRIDYPLRFKVPTIRRRRERSTRLRKLRYRVGHAFPYVSLSNPPHPSFWLTDCIFLQCETSTSYSTTAITQPRQIPMAQTRSFSSSRRRTRRARTRSSSICAWEVMIRPGRRLLWGRRSNHRFRLARRIGDDNDTRGLNVLVTLQ